jgi:biopolymer transport protein TolR
MAGMDITAFTFSFVILYVLLLVAFSTSQSFHHGISSELPKIRHPRSMPHALRENAQIIAVMRSGDVFYRADKVAIDQLAVDIRNNFRELGGERKVYIRADRRARWGHVAEVIDQVRAAGVPEVGFLADQRRQ